MISLKNGRARSERTSDEVEDMLRQELANLSPSERVTLNLLLKEIQEKNPTPEKSLIEIMGDAEYKTPPVDIRTFVKDPYFLGHTCDNIYPKLLDDLVELFDGNYVEAVFTGSIGYGKTFICSIGVCRILYELSCMKDPHASFGLAPDTNISIVCFSINADLARKVAYENIVTKIKASPYFEDHFPFEPTKTELRFPNNIWVAPRASTDTAALGLNVISFLMDEGNFLQTKKTILGDENRAETIYHTIKRRMKSRFERQGRLPGMIFIPSSKKTNEDFTAKLIQSCAGDPTFFARDYCLTGDTKVRLLDGTSRTMLELASGAAGDRFWVYSIDPEGRIVPGSAHSARLTEAGAPIFKVTLDNGEVIRATGNHPFLLRDGSYRRVSELLLGASLMPLYTRLDERGYEEVAQPAAEGRWQKTHRAALRGVREAWPARAADGSPNIVHHVNHRKRDNRPENLLLMSWKEHALHHAEQYDLLAAYVRTDKHRKWASSHMRKLHADPIFAAARDARGRAHFIALRSNPAYVAAQRKQASQALSAFHGSIKGRAAQTDRNIKRWNAQGRKTDLIVIAEAASRGDSITSLATELRCSPSAISQRLSRSKWPSYSELKKAAGHSSPNHCVVKVEPDGFADVYDLTVDQWHNFGLEAGVFVHNSAWDVKPEDYFKTQRFWVLCGNAETASKILTPEEVLKYKDNVPEGCVLIDVPEDFRRDFESRLEESIRDIAGVATVSIHPFIQRREKIREAIDPTMQHPFSTLVYDMSKGGRFLWDTMVAPRQERAVGRVEVSRLRPRINPSAARHIHIDIGLKKDALGFCMAHVSGWKDVVRRAEDGREFAEKAPVYVVDLLLRVVPPMGGEVLLSEVRHLVYDLSAHGYMITSVTLDQFQSADSIQALSAKGYHSQLVSVDTTPAPYDNLKTALYENRVRMYEYKPVIEELAVLQEDLSGNRRKIDHPSNGCFVADTRIPLLDGTLPRLGDLVGKEVWVYSSDKEGRIVPGLAKGRFTKETSDLVDVVLDSGAVERCTPGHPWRLWDGSYKEAQLLRPGIDRLMPISRQWPVNGGYERVVDKHGARTLTHHAVWQNFNGPLPLGSLVHHRNHVKTDNSPANLEAALASEHARMHTSLRHRYDEAWREKLYAGARRFNGSTEGRKAHSQAMRRTMLNMSAEQIRARARNRDSFRNDIDLSRLGSVLTEAEATNANSAARLLNCGRNVVVRVLREHGFDSWDDFRSRAESGLNHKVRAVIPVRCQLPVEVFDLEVAEHSNFALSSGVFVHNSKDVADALAGSLFTLSQQKLTEPLPILKSMAYSPGAWMEEQQQATMAGNLAAGANSNMLPAFMTGASGLDDDWKSPWRP